MNLNNLIEGKFFPRTAVFYRGDLSVIGFAQTLPRRIAASATRYEAGEPLHSLVDRTTGVADVNTYVLAATDLPIIAALTSSTSQFGGIALRGALPLDTGTLVAHTAQAACPIPQLGRVRGKGETAASMDTESEILGLIGDTSLFDYNATGAPDSGELYTIKVASTANTWGLEIVDGNVSKGTLDVVVHAIAYRSEIQA